MNSSIISEIEKRFHSLIETKTNIRIALLNKGIDVRREVSFRQYADIIENEPYRGGGITYGYTPLPASNVKIIYDNENLKCSISWNDPINRDIENNKSDGDVWDGTMIIRKQGSYPINIIDGEMVCDSKTKNQYSKKYFVDELPDDSDYYYGVFPYTLNYVFNYENVTYMNPQDGIGDYDRKSVYAGSWW